MWEIESGEMGIFVSYAFSFVYVEIGLKVRVVEQIVGRNGHKDG